MQILFQHDQGISDGENEECGIADRRMGEI
ncbi:Uncharacterised protein [Vibrio cholerae]|nr:Uncharacterised protein [Vibrio cholerae]